MRSTLLPSLTLALLAGCSMSDEDLGPEQGKDAVFNWSGTPVAGKPVMVRNLRGEIRVELSPDTLVHVVADVRWRGGSELPKDVGYSGAATPNGVLICSLFGKANCTSDDYNGSSDGLQLRGGRMNFSLGGQSAARVIFHVQVPAGVELDLLTVDGSIASSSSAAVHARSVNGDVRVVTAVGPVRAETVNGDVDARVMQLSGTDTSRVASVNGSAFIFVPEGANASVDAETVNGRVRTDFESLLSAIRNGKSVTGTLGSGGAPVVAKTLNGNVGVGRLDAQGLSRLQ